MRAQKRAEKTPTPFPLADLQVLHKREVKTKAELQMTWPSVEEALTIQPVCEDQRSIFFHFFLSFCFGFRPLRKLKASNTDLSSHTRQ